MCFTENLQVCVVIKKVNDYKFVLTLFYIGRYTCQSLHLIFSINMYQVLKYMIWVDIIIKKNYSHLMATLYTLLIGLINDLYL